MFSYPKFRAVTHDGTIVSFHDIQNKEGSLIHVTERKIGVETNFTISHLDFLTDFKDSKGQLLYLNDALTHPISPSAILFLSYCKQKHSFVIRSYDGTFVIPAHDVSNYTYAGTRYDYEKKQWGSLESAIINAAAELAIEEIKKQEKPKTKSASKSKVYLHGEIFPVRNGGIHQLHIMNVGDGVEGKDLSGYAIDKVKASLTKYEKISGCLFSLGVYSIPDNKYNYEVRKLRD